LLIAAIARSWLMWSRWYIGLAMFAIGCGNMSQRDHAPVSKR